MQVWSDIIVTSHFNFRLAVSKVSHQVPLDWLKYAASYSLTMTDQF